MQKETERAGASHCLITSSLSPEGGCRVWYNAKTVELTSKIKILVPARISVREEAGIFPFLQNAIL